MTGNAPRTGREEAKLTQQEAASRFISLQAYLSNARTRASACDHGTRCASNKGISSPANGPALGSGIFFRLWMRNAFKAETGVLGYLGFSYLRGKSHYNPARLLFLALDQDSPHRRVVEAAPLAGLHVSGNGLGVAHTKRQVERPSEPAWVRGGSCRGSRRESRRCITKKKPIAE